ncbi:MAG: AbrB family transcriptional regulator [Bacillota bacterium]|nr:AbrB family transcriptional regulator [Bacillota bacterium]
MSIVYTLLAAAAVGLIFSRFRIPGGIMIGAVIGACATNLILGEAQMPSFFKTAAQIVAGAFIGAGVSRSEMREMRKAFKPAVIVILGLFVLNVLSGLLIYKTSSIDLLTALLCTTPGGISDIPIVAADMGADASKVLVMQFVRYVVGIGIFPTLIGKITAQEDQNNEGASLGTKSSADGVLPVLLTIAVATAAGLLGKLSGLPAGTMAFATIGSIVFKLFYPKANLPRNVRKVAQCMSGAYVGAGIGLAELMELRLLAGPALILFLSLATGTFVIGMTLKRLKLFNFREAMLAATPAGASDMALISADLGIRNIWLILLQVMRMISVITIFPSLLKLVAEWLA